ncbi:MAG: DUF4956 domain-containing protein [Candidatus Eisenbacteria bacterium]
MLGQAIAWVYIKAHRGVSYVASVAQAIRSWRSSSPLVMAVIGNNLARAFGLFGALALIRFRTPVKDARDTIFLFLSVALGISCGTGNILAGIVGSVVIGTVLMQLDADQFGTEIGHDGLLRLSLPRGFEGPLQSMLDRHCDAARLLHVREAANDSMEYAYEITLADTKDAHGLLADVHDLQGATSVSLLLQDTEARP